MAAAAHDVVDRQAVTHDAARAVDIKVDRLIPGLGVQVEQGTDDGLGLLLIDFAVQKDDALLQQRRADIPAAAKFVFYNRNRLHTYPPYSGWFFIGNTCILAKGKKSSRKVSGKKMSSDSAVSL